MTQDGGQPLVPSGRIDQAGGQRRRNLLPQVNTPQHLSIFLILFLR